MAMADDPVTTADPPGDISTRVNRIEAEQTAQRGLLEQILSKVGGGAAGPAAPAPAPAAGGAGLDMAAIQQQVRSEIQEADRRRAAEQNETRWRDDVNKTLESVKRERMPREPETGVRATVQRLVIGRQR
jgi:hypothetical protein